MFNSVTPRPVYELLNPEQDLVHAIPRYQRAYAWGKNQWEKLFEDLQDNDPGYFLGSIICINQTKDTADVLRLELVDGQQRLITLSLLLAALYNRLKRLDLDEDRILDRANLKYRLVSRKRREPRLILQNQNNNNEDYRHMLAEAGVCDPLPGPKPRHAGNRNIFKGYSYFL